MDILYSNLLQFELGNVIMILVGCLLTYLAIAKEMEPSLLLPMGFGAILVNIPFSDALVMSCTTPVSPTSCSPCSCSSASVP